jgi:hypothetical protein
MPTVGRWNGITVLAYFLDHEKWDEHVHCRAGEAEVKISLLDFSVKRVYGTMSTADVRKAVRVVKAHLNECKEAWNTCHP